MLTNVQVTNAKPRERDYSLADGRGLRLLVRASGSKLWQLRYRLDGKARIDSLGVYPDVSLAEAREKRDASRKLVAAGIDPVAARRHSEQERRRALEDTFQVVATAWFEKWRIGKSERHANYVWRRLETDVFPTLGHRPIGDIKTPEVVAMLKAIAKRGVIDIAKRCHQMTGQVFRYAIAHGLASDNPAFNVRPSDVLPSTSQTNYARIDAKELPQLLRRIEAYQGNPATRVAIKLMALTFVRTSELIGARWDEFDFNAAQWRIPATRMKMKSPHIVPLAWQTLELLAILREVTGRSALLFPGERDHEKPMSNGTILMALKRMGYAGKMTGHGFRGLASTILHERGFEHMHIELQLAHQERNRVSAAYNHALYLEQRSKMMQWWADFLDEQARITQSVK